MAHGRSWVVSEIPWAKLWWSWFVSRSHIGLSGHALALGGPLMLLGRASAERHRDGSRDAESDARVNAMRDAGRDVKCDVRDLVWLFDGKGRPVTARTLAGIVRFPEADVQAALDELCDAETLCLSLDGVYGFPNFWRYQETAQAARTRKYRDRRKRHSDGHSDSAGDGGGDGAGDDKRKEERGKRKEDKNPLTPLGGGSDSGLDLGAPANNQTGREQTQPKRLSSSPAGHEVHEAFRTAYSEAGAGTMPRFLSEPWRAAVEHCRDVAAVHRVTLYEAAYAVAKAAKPGEKSWWADVAKVDPYASAKASESDQGKRAKRIAELNRELGEIEGKLAGARRSGDQDAVTKLSADRAGILAEIQDLRGAA